MIAPALLLFMIASRLGELIVARRNTKRLLAHGGIEFAPRHYILIVAVHAGWIVSLCLAWLAGRTTVQPIWVAVFLFFQVARLWVLASIGRRWTTRIIVVPGEKLIRRGPYRYVSHPNYAVVIGEIASLPLALGVPCIALAFSIANAGVLSIRIAAENNALRTYATINSRSVAK